MPILSVAYWCTPLACYNRSISRLLIQLITLPLIGQTPANLSSKRLHLTLRSDVSRKKWPIAIQCNRSRWGYFPAKPGTNWYPCCKSAKTPSAFTTWLAYRQEFTLGGAQCVWQVVAILLFWNSTNCMISISMKHTESQWVKSCELPTASLSKFESNLLGCLQFR